MRKLISMVIVTMVVVGCKADTTTVVDDRERAEAAADNMTF